MPLDTSSLRPMPLTSQPEAPESAHAAPQGLDVSSLRPMPMGNSDSGSSSGDTKPTWGGVGKQAGLGLVSGLPHAWAGATDLMDALNPVTGYPAYLGSKAEQYARHLAGMDQPDAPEPQAPQLTRGATINKLTGMDSLPQPQNPQERVARGMGEGAITMAVPEAFIGKAGPIANAIRGAVVGGISGGAGQAAEEEVPDQYAAYKPLAGLAGGLVGGGLTEGALKLGSLTTGAAKSLLDGLLPSQGAAERNVTKKLMQATSNPDAAIASISDNPADNEIVPNSPGTTAQVTRDPGLLGLERGVQAQHPEDFAVVRGQQNTARREALGEIEPNGHAESVADAFGQHMGDLSQQHDALLSQADDAAQSGVEGLGGGDDATLGAKARGAIQDRLGAVKDRINSLWNAVDPDGTLQAVTSPIKNAFNKVYGAISPEKATTLSPAEQNIAGLVNGYGKTLPFSRVVDLRSIVSAAMRDAAGNNQLAYGRLSQLRGSIESAISDSVAQKAAQEEQAVASGAMHPDDTMASRLESNLGAERQEWYNDRAALGSTGEGATTNAGRGPSSFSRASGTEVPPGKGSGSNQSGPNLHSQTFPDQATADRLKAATAATAEKHATYGNPTIKRMLERPGATYPYNMTDAGVTRSIWQAGSKGGDTLAASLKAAGNSPDAIEAVKNMAAQSLRGKAKNGILNQKILDAWNQQHGPAMDTLEKVAPGTKAKFKDAATAGDHLAQVAADRKQAIDGYQKSVAGKFLNIRDGADVSNTIGKLFGRSDSVSKIEQLVQKAHETGNPDVIQGIRKAVVDYMTHNLVSHSQESGTSGVNLIKSDAFQTFLGKNHNALSKIFEPDDIARMRAVAQDLKRSNLSTTAIKIPGGSNTTQDLAAQAKHGIGMSVLNHIMQHKMVAGMTGWIAHGPIGASTAVALSALREAGVNNTEQLLKEAMLNPQTFKKLMVKAQAAAQNKAAAPTFGGRMRNVAALSAVDSNKPQK